MKLNGIRFIALLAVVILALIQGVYGIQISVFGGGAVGSGSVSMSFDLAKEATLNSEITINGADIRPTTSIIGPTKLFVQAHGVRDVTGKSAQINAIVVDAPNGLEYRSEVQPREGLVNAQTWVSAEQWLTVPMTKSITCTASASYKTLYADVGIEEVKGISRGDYVTLTGYDGKAYASAAGVSASQTATDGSGNSIKIFGHAKDSSGSYSIDTPISSISGLTASFQGLDASSSAGATTQVSQNEHVIGKFSSKAVAGRNTKTRTSNYGTEYDLNMQAIKGSLPTGTVGYYVNPATSANKIQGAVNAAQSGDTINAAAGTYGEDVNINKVLTLKGLGNPTATSFALNAILGTGSGGITAPLVTVNAGSKIQDGITLASINGKVNVNAGTYGDNLDQSFYAKGITLTGINNPITKSITLDQDVAGKISGITANTVNVQNPNAKIQDGVTLASSGGNVNVAAGTYFENVLVDKSLTVNGAGAGSTIVDGNQEGSVFTVGKANPIVNVALSGTTIQGGTGTLTAIQGNDYLAGGGIWNAGTLTLNGVTITRNTASNFGGGIYNQYGTVNFNGGSIVGNTAIAGGGIYSNGGGTVNINGGSVSGNTARSGGGIFFNDGTITMNLDSSITGNIANSDGGGIWIGDGTVTMNTGSSITGNIATLYSGGGIYSGGDCIVNMYPGSSIAGNTAGSGPNYGIGGGIFSRGMVNMDGGSITGNTATVHGGGIYNDRGTVTMNSGSSIASNKANYDGGGIYSWDGTVNMEGSSITENHANQYGGGIYNYGRGTYSWKGTVDMYIGSSITSNTANYGGGIYNIDYGAVTFKDSVGNIIGNWPGYDTFTDPYSFFTPHNIPTDIDN